MVRVSSQSDLLPSVFDRLLDDHPRSAPDVPDTYGQKLGDLHKSLKRDLEDLLNTRRRCVGWPAELEHLKDSLVNYGLPDFTGMDLVTDQGRETLRQMLEDVIRRCETRLGRIKVTLLDEGEPLNRTLRFRIEGLLYVEPAPEPVAFESTLEPVTCNFTVKGEDDGR